jgi:hypothetical protein
MEFMQRQRKRIKLVHQAGLVEWATVLFAMLFLLLQAGRNADIAPTCKRIALQGDRQEFMT